MKVAIIGGTGKLGMALAAQLSKKHEVLIGSRDKAKAERAARTVPGVRGEDELGAAGACEAAILAIPYAAVGRMGALEPALAGKLVISPVVPMKIEKGTFHYAAESGSAAEEIASLLKRSRVAAALHTVPARFMLESGRGDIDVLIAADDKKTFDEAAAIVGSISGVRPLYGGPLSMASSIERITPLLRNLAKMNGMKIPSIKFVA
ncbi:MAG: NAD(P)-binding domain-containing protein [Nitrososphaerales archaeon]|nr:NAD(P)-binding domain-containing protein [Nitrososphaerales archaeon]